MGRLHDTSAGIDCLCGCYYCKVYFMKKEIKSSLGDLSDKIMRASDLPASIANPNYDDISGVLNGMPETGEDEIKAYMELRHQMDWIKLVEDYCQMLSITPIELLTQHRELMKKGLKTKKVRPDNNYGVYDRNKIKLEKEK